MNRKVYGTLAVLGCGWLLWLFLSSPSLTYLPYDLDQKPAKVSCEPLGDLSRDQQDPDNLLTGKQMEVISDYLSKARDDDSATDVTDVEREDRLRADLEETMLVACERARLNRLAHLVVVATAVLLVALLGARPRSTPDLTGPPR